MVNWHHKVILRDCITSLVWNSEVSTRDGRETGKQTSALELACLSDLRVSGGVVLVFQMRSGLIDML